MCTSFVSHLLDTAYLCDEGGHSSSDSDSAGSSYDEDGGAEDGSTNGTTSGGAAADRPKSVHSSGSDSVHSVSVFQKVR